MSKDNCEKIQQNKATVNLLTEAIYNEDILISTTSIQILIELLKQSHSKGERFEFLFNNVFFFEMFEKNIPVKTKKEYSNYNKLFI